MATAAAKQYNGSWFSYASPGEIFAASTVLPFLGIKMSLDDWLIILALLMLIIVAVFMLIGIAKHQIGYSTLKYALTESFSLIDKLTYFLQLFLIISNGFIKLSVLFFYRRLLIVDKRGVFSWVTFVAVAIIFLWTLAYLFTFIFGCGLHMSAYWGSLQGVEKYYGKGGFTIERSFYISDFVTDVMILCLPMPMIWRLRIGTAKRFAVTGIFLLGAMSLAASIARMAMYEEVYRRSFTDLASTEDRHLTSSTILYWSIIECSLALIAACLPILQVFFKGISLPAVIRSVRSVVSLHSLQSQNTQNSTTVGRVNAYSESGRTKLESTDGMHLPHLGEFLSMNNSTTGKYDGSEVLEPGRVYFQESMRTEHFQV
ncbi:uncharacterized protein LY89DRAFT_789440 [Mollisia scopiformis]|uniref:Rhodopsin domain-containing protein n=1 Tax=Mollisia scopiformis TaxID=149040 RepID=A0A132B5S6_MOLSC|nr:uncharacterized protein LY89DRAFT_789440 [Mollisia scopiformis]KUJ07752.1 hypothetical protein LY89DRAFT_789440 [Mollisia scopiformis]